MEPAHLEREKGVLSSFVKKKRMGFDAARNGKHELGAGSN